MAKIAWYYNRLKAMGAKEVLLRVREHVLKITESRHFERLSSVDVDELESVNDFPKLPPKNSLTDDECAGIKEESDAILAGQWHVLRGHTFQVKFPPAWHQDYLCGEVVPDGARLQAKNLDHRSLSEGIDPRIVWETNRWIQFVRLGQYAWLKNDEAVAETIISSLEDWVKENPLGYGINWTSPMEPGIRLTNFTWIHAFLSEANLNDELAVRLDRLSAAVIPSHVWWVWRYHSIGTSANNHLLGELCGLMMALTRWKGGEKWAVDFKKISEIMVKELLLQFSSDGGNKEQGLHYHLFAWEMGWQGILAMQALEMEVSSNLLERMGNAANFFSTVASTDEPWDFGDSDDAHVTPIFLREKTCLQEWQAWMQGTSLGSFISHWFGKSPYYKGGQHYGDWVLFPDSGYAVYRKDGLMLRLDGSPLGFGSMAAHGHLDALHLSMWYDGKALIIDPGTGSYFDNKDVRDFFLSAEAHNAPYLLSSEDYPIHAGPFLWTNHHDNPAWFPSDNSMRVTVNYGESQLSRTVQVKGDEVLVTDDISGYNGEVMTTWLASPAVEFLADGSVQRERICLRCEVDNERMIFHKSEVKKQAGHCSAYFRAHQFSPFAQVVRVCEDGSSSQVTRFNIEKIK